MMGVMDERGRLLGRMKLMGLGTKPNSLEVPGIEKSFISLFIMTPICLVTMIHSASNEV